MKPIGLCDNLLTRTRTDTTEVLGWENALKESGLPYEHIDCYKYDIIHEMEKYSGILWHYGNFVNADLMEARNILDIASSKGLAVFPDHNTAWHFDDKIAESYLLDSVGAPIPKYWVFYELNKVLDWLKNKAEYPLVAKLRRGSGSNNVKLLKDYHSASKYAKRMLSRGYSPTQNLLFKTYSKVQSTRSIATFKKRIKRIPDFLNARRFGHGMPVEKGYCYFQEFIKNDGYDLKVVVVGDKCSFFARNVRKGSFKASGGGDFFYDKTKIPESVVKTAFDTAEKIGSQCIGFDFVVDNTNQTGRIIEMCFGFDFLAISDCGGYWDKELIWHDEPLYVRSEVIENVFAKRIKE